MTYAHREDIYDADTHMMEHPDWIRDFADKDIKIIWNLLLREIKRFWRE